MSVHPSSHRLRSFLSIIIFMVRWLLYPINLGLVAALCLYIGQFLIEDVHFIWHALSGGEADLDLTMVAMLGFVDASMVANLIIMVVQSGHEIFISRFEADAAERPQYLTHMDTGIMKVKVALSISSITLVQLLKDFVNIENISWDTIVHRSVVHGVALCSALMMALIWRITHASGQPPSSTHQEH